MKTFKALLAEIGPPQSDKGKVFMQKHLIQVNADDDETYFDPDLEDFEKTPPRLADYIDGEDEEVYESIMEEINSGPLKLNDGSKVTVSSDNAKLLNTLLNGLNSANKKKMEKVLMMDKDGFDEILGFAREAL